jgi:hypothetical protein
MLTNVPTATSRHAKREEGVSMVATLVVVVILGVVASVVIAGQNTNSKNQKARALPGVTTTTAPRSTGSASEESTVAACQADYQSINTALGAYKALNGHSPAPGTSWATSSLNGGPFLTTWPSQVRSFTLVWTGTTLNVVPRIGTASEGSMGDASAKTGCFAP